MTSPVERKHEIERLALLCELDRARVRLQRQRARKSVSTLVPPVVGDTLDLARLLPGRWGRWARRLSFAASLVGRLA